MVRSIFLVLTIALMAFGCRTFEPTEAPNNGPTWDMMSGTETLGDIDIPIADGSGMVIAGVGMRSGSGDISINVPGAVQQVILYWQGFMLVDGTDGSVNVNGTPVAGTLIGGPTYFFGVTSPAYSSTHRADITGLVVVSSGANTVSISGMDFTRANNGAGLVVIYDDGSGYKNLSIKDGDDLAWVGFPPLRDTTVPQTFSFAAHTADRTAELSIFAASVAADRPNVIEVTMGGVPTRFVDMLYSAAGADFDALTLPVTVPAGISSMTVQLLSEKDASSVFTGEPASLVWSVGTLAILDEECGPCEGKVTALTLQYNGSAAADIVVQQRNDGVVVFDGNVAAGGQFSFVGADKHGTLGPEIEIYVDGQGPTDIHTSCSQPIGPGLVAGDFEVISGYSRIGGLLCEPGDWSDDDDDDDDMGCECDGRVTDLTLQYNGSASADILVEGKKGTDRMVVFDGNVAAGGQFSFVGWDKHGTLGTEINIYVDGGEPTMIHTSCSQPIAIGMVFGDFEIIDGNSRNGGQLCEIDRSSSTRGDDQLRN